MCAEARGAAQHPVCAGEPPTTTNQLTQYISSAEAERQRDREASQHGCVFFPSQLCRCTRRLQVAGEMDVTRVTGLPGAYSEVGLGAGDRGCVQGHDYNDWPWN